MKKVKTGLKKLLRSSMLLLYALPLFSYKAVIIVPVADLVGQPLLSNENCITSSKKYEQLPFCGGQQKPHNACPRLHQLLYNDVVEVIKTTKDEACIQISHAFYCTLKAVAPQTTYWTLTKNLISLDDLEQKKINCSHIPQPVDFKDPDNKALHNITVATLRLPHHDKKTGLTLSAGTRFTCTQAPKNGGNSGMVEVFAIDYKQTQEYRTTIPADKCVLTTQKKTHEQRITDYVSLLQKWANNQHGFIPYTWGGTSFTSTINEPYTEIITQSQGGDYSYYQFASHNPQSKTGLDCSGALLRATQICGIPYFFKNSTTIAQGLTALSPHEQLVQGDIIIIRGHVMVVSDLTHNLLIESRSYAHGYGKLHEIPISDVFVDIHNYNDLINAYHSKKSLKRKDRNGIVRDSFNDFKLLKIASVWEKI